MIDFIFRFTKLNTESFEVKEQVEKNQKSVEENDRMLKFGYLRLIQRLMMMMAINVINYNNCSPHIHSNIIYFNRKEMIPFQIFRDIKTKRMIKS